MTETQAWYGSLCQREISGEDYARNKKKDREDALDDAIADATSELKGKIRVMLMSYYGELDPTLDRESELHKEAIERIKKCL